MKYICILISMAFLAACEQKETTVTNPPGEKKTESNTTVIDKSSPAGGTSTESNTTVNTGSSPGTSTTTTTTSSSPSP